jgi:hypothetical protein
MLVGKGNTGHPTQIQAHHFGATLDFADAEAHVNQENYAFGFNGAAVAAGAGAQHVQRNHGVFRW